MDSMSSVWKSGHETVPFTERGDTKGAEGLAGPVEGSFESEMLEGRPHEHGQ